MVLVVDRRRLLAASGAGLLAAVLPGRAFAQPSRGFTHGVASGEPSQTSVVLWTRYVAPSPVRLRLEIAHDPAFQRIVLTGEAEASPAADCCARAIAEGLAPGRWYHYRFIAPDGQTSHIGRTRTLPDGDTDSFRIAVFSCANGTSGWFNAYAHAAARDDIDLAIHTGDYIYESPLTRADAQPGIAAQRALAPLHEIVTRADYRQRYASYRLDTDLAELHRRLPMIAVWDDHETANNSWRDGASAHDPATEGPWTARRDAGMRVWREWMPVRGDWYGSHRIGNLATLFRLETRLLGRSQQLDDDLDAIFEKGATRPTLDAFGAGPLADPARAMMDSQQEAWLASGMRTSVASGQKWQLLIQQVIMGALLFPRPNTAWFKGAAPPELMAELQRRAAALDAGLPYSLDKWDGYPAARQRLYDSARTAGANLVTLTGDSHNAWAFDLADKAGPIGVEFAGQSVSSYGFERRFNGDAARLAADFIATNPDLKWMDSSQRGYLTLDIRKDRIDTEYVFVPAASGRSAKESGRKKLSVAHGARRLEV
jgi:alkaline phosphatase D